MVSLIFVTTTPDCTDNDGHGPSVALAAHTTDPPPISTTIKKCASEFKKVGCIFFFILWLDDANRSVVVACLDPSGKRRLLYVRLININGNFDGHRIFNRTHGSRISCCLMKISCRICPRCWSGHRIVCWPRCFRGG